MISILIEVLVFEWAHFNLCIRGSRPEVFCKKHILKKSHSHESTCEWASFLIKLAVKFSEQLFREHFCFWPIHVFYLKYFTDLCTTNSYNLWKNICDRFAELSKNKFFQGIFSSWILVIFILGSQLGTDLQSQAFQALENSWSNSYIQFT